MQWCNAMENTREVSTAAKQVLVRRCGWLAVACGAHGLLCLCVCVCVCGVSGCVRRVDRILTEAFWGASGMVQGVSMRGVQGEICQDDGAQSSARRDDSPLRRRLSSVRVPWGAPRSHRPRAAAATAAARSTHRPATGATAPPLILPAGRRSPTAPGWRPR